MKPQRLARYYYLKVLRLQGDPHSLALGVAIGLFVGVTPTLPLHTVLIIGLAGLLRGNIIAGLIASVVISNPLTMLPQYYFSWRIGSLLLPGHLSWERIKGLLVRINSGADFQEILASIGRLGLDSVAVMLLGGILLATPFTIAGYLLSLRFFTTLRKRQQEKHILN
ncbi:DUF2062 domain-containing protein [Thiovibrio sp. JS02]